MEARDFCYWLKGYLGDENSVYLTDATKRILEKLDPIIEGYEQENPPRTKPAPALIQLQQGAKPVAAESLAKLSEPPLPSPLLTR